MFFLKSLPHALLIGSHLAFLMVILVSSEASAVMFPVTKTLDTKDGICDADCSLREAIDAANGMPGLDIIQIPAGTYRLDIADPASGDDANAMGDLDITDDVEIIGAGADMTFIDGGEGVLGTPDRVFHIDPGAVNDPIVEIRNLTIQNGNPGASGGGGIFNASSNGELIVTDTHVNDNSANFGGGIESRSDTTLTNVTMDGNGASRFGGALNIPNDDNLTIINSTIRNNTAIQGSGGINFNPIGANLTISNSTISGNVAGPDVGTVSAGGILFSPAGGTLTITNSTISGNSATDEGGGIEFRPSPGNASLLNVTIVNNMAAMGAGILNGGANTVEIQNSILDNAGGGTNCDGVMTSQGHNIEDGNSCTFNAIGDMIDTDPGLEALAFAGGDTQTHAPSSDSPAIDNGDAAAAPAQDQRGVDRDAMPDIGAHEASCGDGVIQSLTGEECDDGNTDDGDGCSAMCANEPAPASGGCNLRGTAGTWGDVIALLCALGLILLVGKGVTEVQ